MKFEEIDSGREACGHRQLIHSFILSLTQQTLNGLSLTAFPSLDKRDTSERDRLKECRVGIGPGAFQRHCALLCPFSHPSLYDVDCVRGYHIAVEIPERICMNHSDRCHS